MFVGNRGLAQWRLRDAASAEPSIDERVRGAMRFLAYQAYSLGGQVA
ncbi:MAG: hypothetical protein ACRER2_13485 [Methylococcales bacterium]